MANLCGCSMAATIIARTWKARANERAKTIRMQKVNLSGQKVAFHRSRSRRPSRTVTKREKSARNNAEEEEAGLVSKCVICLAGAIIMRTHNLFEWLLCCLGQANRNCNSNKLCFNLEVSDSSFALVLSNWKLVRRRRRRTMTSGGSGCPRAARKRLCNALDSRKRAISRAPWLVLQFHLSGHMRATPSFTWAQ